MRTVKFKLGVLIGLAALTLLGFLVLKGWSADERKILLEFSLVEKRDSELVFPAHKNYNKVLPVNLDGHRKITCNFQIADDHTYELILFRRTYDDVAKKDHLYLSADEIYKGNRFAGPHFSGTIFVPRGSRTKYDDSYSTLIIGRHLSKYQYSLRITSLTSKTEAALENLESYGETDCVYEK